MARKAGMSAGVEVARISVKVSPDSKRFRSELQRDLDAIEKSMKVVIDVEPNLGNFRQEVKSKTSGMKTSVKVDADVDRNFFGRVADKLDNLKAPSFGSGINPAGYAVIAAGALAVLTPLLGVISTAIVALPGLLAAVLAPIGAITLGLEGMGKAVGVLKGPFDQLKSTMSAVNEKAFTPVFEKLGQIFPVLERAMPRVSQGLATMVGSIVDAVTSSAGMEKIENTLSNIGAAIGRAAPGVGKFTDGLIGLVEAFTGKPLQGIADWFNGVGDSFQKWVEKMTRPDWLTGKTPLEDAFSGLGQTLKVVIDLIGDLGQQGIDFMSDPKKVQDFKEGLQDVAKTLSTIAELSGKVGSGMANMLPTFQWDTIKEDLLAPFKSDNAGWRGIWDDLKSFFKNNQFLGDGPDFSGWAEKMQAPFVTAATFIRTKFNEAVAGVEGVLTDIGSRVQATFSTIFSTLQNPGQALVNMFSSIVPAIGGVFAQISSIAQGTWNGIVAAAQGAWSGVVGAVQSAWESIKGAVSAGIEAVISFVSGMGGRIVGAITSIDLSGAGRALMDGLLGGIKAGAEAVFNFVSGIAAKIKALKGPLPYDKVVLIPNGEALMQGLHTGMSNGLQDVLSLAKDVAGQIQQAMEAGTDGSGMFSNLQPDDLKQMLAALEQEKKRLKIDKNALPTDDKDGRKALQNQIDQLQAQKDLLDYQQDRLKNEKQFGNVAEDDPLAKAAAGLMATPVNFAKATGQQFLSDIGVSGNGLISKAITEGIQYIFQIGSVDEALSIKDRTERTQAMKVTGPR